MNPMLLKCQYPTNLAAAEAGKFPILKVPAGFNIEILGIRWGNKADIVADAAAYQTFNMKNGAKVVATGHTQAAYTAPTMVELAITAANKYLAAGDVLSFEPTPTGAGKAVAGLVIEVDYQFIRVPQ
jgi:hypothetical protein